MTVTTQSTIPVTPIQHVMPPPAQVAPQPQAAAPVTTPTHPQLAVVPQDPQVQPQPQMQLAVTPQVQMVAPQAMMPQALAPGMTSGAIVVPVTVPQYMTYTPQPVTMMVNRPAQLVIPQYPTPMQQPMYDPMAMQMMQQQMMMQMMMQQQMMAPPRPPQQPIPVKMILPDGSTVSIKHYVPGNFFKNVWRAVTP